MPEAENEALRQYANTVLVIVRWTADTRTAEPQYGQAVVGRFSAGDAVPLEDVREPVLRWLIDEADYQGDRHWEIRRRDFDEGASGAEAVLILTLLSGAAGGVASKLTEEAFEEIRGRLNSRAPRLQSMDKHIADLDGLRHALARAIDVRASDLRLVEHQANDARAAATFEVPGGQVFGVRMRRNGVAIRALEPGEY